MMLATTPTSCELYLQIVSAGCCQRLAAADLFFFYKGVASGLSTSSIVPSNQTL